MAKIKAKSAKTVECLLHFFNHRYKVLSDEVKSNLTDELVNFFGVAYKTIQSWINQDRFPKGLELLKLRYFLRQFDYELEEENALPEEVRQVGNLIACGLVDLKDAAKELRYNDATDELLRYLLNRRSMGEARLTRFESFNKEHQSLRQRLFKFTTIEEVELNVDSSKKELPTFSQQPGWWDSLIWLLKNIRVNCQASSGWLKDLLSDKYGAEIRRKFRADLGDDSAFKLANELDSFQTLAKALCSEKARENQLGLKSDVITINEINNGN